MGKIVVTFISAVLLLAVVAGYFGYTRDTEYETACKNAGGIVVGEKYRSLCIERSVVLPVQSPW